MCNNFNGNNRLISKIILKIRNALTICAHDFVSFSFPLSACVRCTRMFHMIFFLFMVVDVDHGTFLFVVNSV